MATLAEENNERDCQICGNTFLKNSMVNSKIEGPVCKECFKNEGKYNAKPQQRHRPKAPPSNSEGNNQEICNKLFPHPEKFHMRRRPESSTTLICTTSTPSISKKPLQCPYQQCGKFVSVFEISAHFKYEHKEVPHIFTHFDARSALEFSPKIIQHGVLCTMVLLNLRKSEPNLVPVASSTSRKIINESTKDAQACLIVLATRLTDYDVEEKQCKDEKNRHHRSNEVNDSDKWIFWLGSNISINLSYTIAISSLDNEMRLKYFGPVLHIEEKPLKLWQDGRCLLMNKYQIERMSDNFQKKLSLDVIVYQED
ncbi:hypothetical protein HHI36_006177 [Cryptolaemus montrouzieri]|uniref:DUF4729 domain-containing protein n=1 Tax=Cryptolaemus montrouzieri TaxID=559131 RepID=A0ABD2NWL3_9CUCU